MLSAQKVIEKYQLKPLNQEGGYFNRYWSSGHIFDNSAYGSQYPEGKTHESANLIYYLLTADAFSAMHALQTDEHWLFHMGDPLEILCLHPDGTGQTIVLGTDLEKDQTIQTLIPANSWQGARLVSQKPGQGCGYSLVSCLVVPAFEWDDFQLADAGELLHKYPAFAGPIIQRTRYNPAKGEE